ncbi:hypothetical protein HBI56_139820 [Parastagonospora nodorum]|nr:hypothetical protein HBH56_127970 [Parastagonospora nodorum]KAH3947144.1 hypothetical protein HBH53_118260 [Parastagonospora nodorum]KAH3970726.1 hypothetical protein HBH51_114690 [Parastagonospora nodorum]KAH3971833.1 hypothetical protein HBH52_156950 [Parastagonospora nodorum]KAH3996421.1 hypothetical protein HBI10_156050 [Parastagonospora nodorum]
MGILVFKKGRREREAIIYGLASGWFLMKFSRGNVDNNPKLELLQLRMGRPVGDHSPLLDLVGRCSDSQRRTHELQVQR